MPSKKTTNPISLDYDFVSRVSHQMRTPATIIKESVELLLDGIPGSLNPKQRKVLDICKSNVDRLINEMNRILKQLYKKTKLYETVINKGRVGNGKEKDINS